MTRKSQRKTVASTQEVTDVSDTEEANLTVSAPTTPSPSASNLHLGVAGDERNAAPTGSPTLVAPTRHGLAEQADGRADPLQALFALVNGLSGKFDHEFGRMNERLGAVEQTVRSQRSTPVGSRIQTPVTSPTMAQTLEQRPPGESSAAPPTRTDTSSTVNPRTRRVSDRVLCEKYSGSSHTVSAQEWLDVFNAVTLRWTDEEKLEALPRHLSDDAMSWFALEVVPDIETITWTECKNRLIARFGLAIANPIVEAMTRKLSGRETVADYYNAKKRLMTQAKASEAIQVELLTNGMPESYRPHIASHKPKTTAEWLGIALSVEQSKGKTYSGPKGSTFVADNLPKDRTDRKTWKKKNDRRSSVSASDSDNRDIPSEKHGPCPHCLKLGRREMHWKRKCPRLHIMPPDKTDTPRVDDVPQILTIADNDYVYIDAKVNGYSFRPFIDTGSKITCLSARAARRAGLQPDPKTSITIRQVDGLADTLGLVKPRLTIGRKTMTFPIHVLPNLSSDMLVGIDAGTAFDLTIKLSSRRHGSNNNEVSIANIDDQSDVIGRTERPDINRFLDRFDAFAKSDTDIGRFRDVEHVIRIKPDVTPVYRRPYRQSEVNEQRMRAIVGDLERKGLITRSRSPWALPMFLVAKGSGGHRPVIDYRPLNAVTISEREPIPLIRDVIDRLHGSRVYSTLDINWAFWNLRLHPSSRELTSFITPFGQYEWNVLPMGLRNGPSAFQRELRRALGDLVGNGVLQYLDDIIVYSKTVEEHYDLLTRLFTRLGDEGLRLKREKCRFFEDSVSFLGFIVSAGQVRPSDTKIRAILEFPTPQNPKNISQFLGVGNYFRHYIPNFATIAEPLVQLCRKGIDWRWGDEQQHAFETLKNKFVDSPILEIFDPKRPIVLQTDASGVGLGGVLWQRFDNDEPKAIAYWSQTLNVHERRYSAPELECLAVVRAIEHFRVYLEGVHFDVWTDCNALRWLFSLTNPASRLFRWALRLQTYDYTVSYRPGVTNVIADAFSRNPIAFIDVDDFALRQHEIESYGLRKTRRIDDLIHVHYRGIDRRVVPPSLIAKVLHDSHDAENHPGLQDTTRFIVGRYWWPNARRDINRYVQTCHTCQLTKPPNDRPRGHWNPIVTPDAPSKVWGIDTIVIGRAADETANKYVLTCVDHHSRYTWAKKIKKNTSEAVITFLKSLFDSVGRPEAILCDNGRNYVSDRLKKFLTKHGVRRLVTPPYRPMAAGLVEKTNDKIMRGVRAAMADKPNIKWSTALDTVLQTINERTHDITGFAPRYLHFSTVANGHVKPDTPVNEAQRLATERSREAQAKRKHKHDSVCEKSEYEVNDLVKYRIPSNDPILTKTTAPFVGPCRVIAVLGQETYRLELFDRHSKKAIKAFTSHSSHLYRYNLRQTSVQSLQTSVKTIPTIAYIDTIDIEVNDLSWYRSSIRNIDSKTWTTASVTSNSLSFAKTELEVCEHMSIDVDSKTPIETGIRRITALFGLNSCQSDVYSHLRDENFAKMNANIDPIPYTHENTGIPVMIDDQYDSIPSRAVHRFHSPNESTNRSFRDLIADKLPTFAVNRSRNRCLFTSDHRFIASLIATSRHSCVNIDCFVNEQHVTRFAKSNVTLIDANDVQFAIDYTGNSLPFTDSTVTPVIAFEPNLVIKSTIESFCSPKSDTFGYSYGSTRPSRQSIRSFPRLADAFRPPGSEAITGLDH